MSVIVRNADRILERAIEHIENVKDFGQDSNRTRMAGMLLLLSGRPLQELFNPATQYQPAGERSILIKDRPYPLLCNVATFTRGVACLRSGTVVTGNRVNELYASAVTRFLLSTFFIKASPRIVRHIFAAIAYKKYKITSTKEAFLKDIFDNKRLKGIPSITFTGSPVKEFEGDKR